MKLDRVSWGFDNIFKIYGKYAENEFFFFSLVYGGSMCSIRIDNIWCDNSSRRKTEKFTFAENYANPFEISSDFSFLGREKVGKGNAKKMTGNHTTLL